MRTDWDGVKTEMLPELRAGLTEKLSMQARKLAAADVKLVLDELEEKIMNCHNEIREQEEAAQKALEHHRKQRDSLNAQSPGELSPSGTPETDELESPAVEEDAVLNGEQSEELETQTVQVDSVLNGEQSEESETQTVEVDTIVNGEQSDELETQTVEEDTVVNRGQTEAMSRETTTIVKQEVIDEVLPLLETRTMETDAVVNREQSDELENQTVEEDTVVNGGRTEATRMETPTIVKQEVIFDEILPLQNASTRTQSNHVEGEADCRSGTVKN